MIMLTATSAAPATAAATEHAGGGSALALIVIIAAVAAWIGIRSMIRSLRAGKTKSVTGGKFADYALHVMVNAAKIDGRANDEITGYEEAWRSSPVGKDLWPVRNVKPLWSKFGTAIGIALGGLDMWTNTLGFSLFLPFHN